MIERLSMVAITFALGGCTAAPPAKPVAPISAATPPPAAPAGCEVLRKSYYPLERLKGQGASDKVSVMEPADPAGMARELSAQAAAARTAKPEDAEMARLVADLDTRFSTLGARLHEFTEARAASREDDARAAMAALLRAAKDSDDFLAASHRRCDTPRPGKPSSERLPPELIQKIVRARFGEYRACYEDGLRRDLTLAGYLSVRFVIEIDGRVTGVKDAGDAPPDPFAWRVPDALKTPSPARPRLPDPAVTTCIIAAFRKLTFPAPESGVVTVTYPLQFAPRK